MSAQQVGYSKQVSGVGNKQRFNTMSLIYDVAGNLIGSLKVVVRAVWQRRCLRERSLVGRVVR